MKNHIYTEAGGHPQNEDAALLKPHGACSSTFIVALADGQGGHAGGARASRLAVTTAVEHALGLPLVALADPDTMLECCEAADRAVSADASAGLTTLVAFAITPESVVGASCGDSAAALWMSDRFLLLTRGQAKNPPVGSGAARLTPFSALLARPWRVLVASDGVWKYVGWERIQARMAVLSGRDLLDQLRQDALGHAPNLPDDFTAVALEA